MRPRIAITAWFLLATFAPAHADDAELRTIAGGVVCQSPFRLSEGIAASNRGDMAWVKESGCITLPAGLRAIKIDRAASLGQPWKVRLFGPTGQGITVWGYAPSFTDSRGKKLWNF